MRVLLTLFAVMWVHAAHADLKTDLRACARLENSIQRLACFDKLTAANAPKPSIAEPAGFTGSWVVRSEVSKRTDRTNVFLHVRSNNIVHKSLWKDKVQFTIVCRENETNVYAAYPFFLTTDRTLVTYRIDKEPPKRVWLSVSTDYKAFGWWYGSNAIPFIKSLVGKSSLLLWVVPHGENEVMAEFDIRGLENALKPLRKACNW